MLTSMALSLDIIMIHFRILHFKVDDVFSGKMVLCKKLLISGEKTALTK